MWMMGRQLKFMVAVLAAISLGLAACGKNNKKNETPNAAAQAQASDVQNLRKTAEEAEKRAEELNQALLKAQEESRSNQVRRRQVEQLEKTLIDKEIELKRLRDEEKDWSSVQQLAGEMAKTRLEMEALKAQMRGDSEQVKAALSDVSISLQALTATLEQKIEELKTEIGNNKVDSSGLIERMNALTNSLQLLNEGKVSREDLEALKVQLSEMVNELARKPMEAIAALSAQVQELARAVGELQTASSKWATKEEVEAARSTLEQAQVKLNESIAALEQKIGAENPAVAELKTAAATLTEQISTLSTELNDIKGKIGSGSEEVNAKITELAGKFGQIEQSISEMAARIKALEENKTTPPTACPEGQEKDAGGECKPKTDQASTVTKESCQAESKILSADGLSCVAECNAETEENKDGQCQAKTAATTVTKESCQAESKILSADGLSCVEKCGEAEENKENQCQPKEPAQSAKPTPK